ncbi:MAG: hypothetical protein ACREXM_19070, partial [Gammaproteobacteria bacterium]
DLLWLVGLPITEIVNHHAGSMTVYIYLRVDIPVNFVGIRQGLSPFRGSLVVRVTDHDRTDRASRSTFESNGKNEDRTEVHLLLRHFGQIQILDLVNACLREVVVVCSERKPWIVSVLPGRHGREWSYARFVHGGVGKRVVQTDEHDLFCSEEDCAAGSIS